MPLLEDTLTLLEHRLVAQNTGIRIERHYAFAPGLAPGRRRQDQAGVLEFLRERRPRHDAGGVLTVSLEQVGDDWQINFADTGPGMSRQLVEKIFEPFQSQFEGGTGLGLAIVYQIVQAHEGKVWARSKVGEGSVFVLRLRRMAAAEAVPRGTARLSKMPASPLAAGKRCGGGRDRRRAHG